MYTTKNLDLVLPIPSSSSSASKWLWGDISAKIDPNQFGNRKNMSTCHYLIGLLHALYSNADKPKSLSTLIMTEFSKAFDRINHNITIAKWCEIYVRPCVISLVIDLLSNCQQTVRYRGQLSESTQIGVGVPQGDKLGPILFLIMINDACRDTSLSYFKYVDDLPIVECRMNNTQISQLQHQIELLESWTSSNDMKLNASKCSTMSVSFPSRPYNHLCNTPLPCVILWKSLVL